jgi:ferritin-like metal-binding protein YciE
LQADEVSRKGKKCKGMEGLVEEGAEVMEEDFEGSLMDAGTYRRCTTGRAL